MFTGIIQSVASVTSVSYRPDGVGLVIDLNELNLDYIRLGDSISVNGACLTIAKLEKSFVEFDVSSETLSKCLIGKWKTGDLVNLELALTLQTPIGGHLVSGHIDGTAELIHRQDNQDFTTMQFRANRSIGKFLANKGSVAIEGVSLTTNNVEDVNDGTHFDVMLVPHTLENTNLGNLNQNSSVHVEVDQIARYVQRFNECEEL